MALNISGSNPNRHHPKLWRSLKIFSTIWIKIQSCELSSAMKVYLVLCDLFYIGLVLYVIRLLSYSAEMLCVGAGVLSSGYELT